MCLWQLYFFASKEQVNMSRISHVIVKDVDGKKYIVAAHPTDTVHAARNRCCQPCVFDVWFVQIGKLREKLERRYTISLADRDIVLDGNCLSNGATVKSMNINDDSILFIGAAKSDSAHPTPNKQPTAPKAHVQDADTAQRAPKLTRPATSPPGATAQNAARRALFNQHQQTQQAPYPQISHGAYGQVVSNQQYFAPQGYQMYPPSMTPQQTQAYAQVGMAVVAESRAITHNDFMCLP